MSRTTRPYTEFLYERLAASEEEAVGYLNAALEEGDPQVFWLALRDVAEARGGLGKWAAVAHLDRESLEPLSPESGAPKFASLTALLAALGLQLTVSRKSAA